MRIVIIDGRRATLSGWVNGRICHPTFSQSRVINHISKGPAIEASGIFATMFPTLLEKAIGKAFSKKAQKYLYKCPS